MIFKLSQYILQSLYHRNWVNHINKFLKPDEGINCKIISRINVYSIQETIQTVRELPRNWGRRILCALLWTSWCRSPTSFIPAMGNDLDRSFTRPYCLFSRLVHEGEGRSLFLRKGILFLSGMIYLLIETYQALSYPRAFLPQLHSNILSIL